MEGPPSRGLFGNQKREKGCGEKWMALRNHRKIWKIIQTSTKMVVPEDRFFWNRKQAKGFGGKWRGLRSCIGEQVAEREGGERIDRWLGV